MRPGGRRGSYNFFPPAQRPGPSHPPSSRPLNPIQHGGKGDSSQGGALHPNVAHRPPYLSNTGGPPPSGVTPSAVPGTHVGGDGPSGISQNTAKMLTQHSGRLRPPPALTQTINPTQASRGQHTADAEAPLKSEAHSSSTPAGPGPGPPAGSKLRVDTHTKRIVTGGAVESSGKPDSEPQPQLSVRTSATRSPLRRPTDSETQRTGKSGSSSPPESPNGRRALSPSGNCVSLPEREEEGKTQRVVTPTTERSEAPPSSNTKVVVPQKEIVNNESAMAVDTSPALEIITSNIPTPISTPGGVGGPCDTPKQRGASTAPPSISTTQQATQRDANSSLAVSTPKRQRVSASSNASGSSTLSSAQSSPSSAQNGKPRSALSIHPIPVPHSGGGKTALSSGSGDSPKPQRREGGEVEQSPTPEQHDTSEATTTTSVTATKSDNEGSGVTSSSPRKISREPKGVLTTPGSPPTTSSQSTSVKTIDSPSVKAPSTIVPTTPKGEQLSASKPAPPPSRKATQETPTTATNTSSARTMPKKDSAVPSTTTSSTSPTLASSVETSPTRQLSSSSTKKASVTDNTVGSSTTTSEHQDVQMGVVKAPAPKTLLDNEGASTPKGFQSTSLAAKSSPSVKRTRDGERAGSAQAASTTGSRPSTGSGRDERDRYKDPKGDREKSKTATGSLPTTSAPQPSTTSSSIKAKDSQAAPQPSVSAARSGPVTYGSSSTPKSKSAPSGTVSNSGVRSPHEGRAVGESDNAAKKGVAPSGESPTGTPSGSPGVLQGQGTSKVQKTSSGQSASSVSVTARGSAGAATATNSLNAPTTPTSKPAVAARAATTSSTASTDPSAKADSSKAVRRKAVTSAPQSSAARPTSTGTSSTSALGVAPSSRADGGQPIRQATGKRPAPGSDTGGKGGSTKPTPAITAATEDADLALGIKLQQRYCERPELNNVATNLATLIKLGNMYLMYQKSGDNSPKLDGVSGQEPQVASTLNETVRTEQPPNTNATVAAVGQENPPSLANDWSKEWDDARRNLEASIETYKRRALRHLCILDQGKEDIIAIVKETKRLRTERQTLRDAVNDAITALETAKSRRKNREEYESLAREINKKQCRRLSDAAASREAQKINEMNEELRKLELKTEQRRRQMAVLHHFNGVFEQSVTEGCGKPSD